MEVTTNRLAIQEAFKQGTIRAICGYPGIGKTFLTNVDSRFVDCFFSEHYYLDKEKGIINPEFPINYARKISKELQRGRIIVCAMHPEARKIFKALGIPYLVIYPNAAEKERYFNIYDTRPDVREWINLNKEVWDNKIASLQELSVPVGCFKDEIPTGMNLTDYLAAMGIVSPILYTERVQGGQFVTHYRPLEVYDPWRRRMACNANTL